MESTNRPYVVCHILMALDGKIDGACMSAACAKAYGQLRTTFDCQATIYGTTTMAETYSDGLAPAVLPACETVWPHEDYAAPSDVHNFIVSVDPQGILGWNDKYVEKRGRPKAHVIEVLTEQVSKEALIKAGKGEVSSQKRRKCQGKERIEGRNPWNSYTSQLKGRKSPMRVGVNRPLWQAYTDLRWRRARVIG